MLDSHVNVTAGASIVCLGVTGLSDCSLNGQGSIRFGDIKLDFDCPWINVDTTYESTVVNGNMTFVGGVVKVLDKSSFP